MLRLIGTHPVDIPKTYPGNPGWGDAKVPTVQPKGPTWIPSTRANPGLFHSHSAVGEETGGSLEFLAANQIQSVSPRSP